MTEICYNCGVELTKTNRTVEHVPAKNLYTGFDQSYKTNRITVPACNTCNNLYSKTDQELRDTIAVKTEDASSRPELLSKGIRSITREKNWKERFIFTDGGRGMTVKFNYGKLRELHIKNFKALFFRKYGIPVPENFKIEIIADGDEDKIKEAQMLYSIAGENYEHSGHPDIFKFVLKGLESTNDEVSETNVFSETDMVIGMLVYHEELMGIVVATKDTFLSKLLKK